MKPDPDHRLIERVGAGDPGAFSELYDLTSARVFGLISTLLRSRQDAEDVLQETFVQVWNSAGRYDPALGSPMTWLLMIARSRALDRLRKVRRVSAHEVETSNGAGAESSRAAAGGGGSDLGLSAAQTRLLACLPREQYDAVTLAFYRGMTREEIATALGVPVGTVKTRIRLAMQALRDAAPQDSGAKVGS